MSEVDWRILHHALDTGRSQRPMTSSELAASRESARSAGSSLPRLTLSDQLRIIGTSAELRSMLAEGSGRAHEWGDPGAAGAAADRSRSWHTGSGQVTSQPAQIAAPEPP